MARGSGSGRDTAHELVRDLTVANLRRQRFLNHGGSGRNRKQKRGCRPTLVPSASVTPQAAIIATVIVF